MAGPLELLSDVEAALARGALELAAAIAARIPSPALHLAAMERIHAATLRGPRMFELKEKPALLVKFNPRPENHGTEVKPAGDLKFRVNIEQGALDALHPVLRYMFFTKNGTVGDIDQNLADQVHEAPNLRAGAKLLGPHKWAAKFAGYELRIHLGTRESAHVVITDCDFNDIAFEPQEGGTVVLRFRLQFHPDERIAGKLSMLQKTMVDISLTAPEGAREVEPGEDEGGDEE